MVPSRPEQAIPLKFVDIWSARLALAPDRMPELLAVLDSDERQKAESFKFPVKRDRYILIRGLLRQTLAGYMDGMESAGLRFDIGEYGKPGLSCGSLHFNLSHTADHLVIAVANFPDIGVDIEAISPRKSLDALARRVFSEREFNQWRLLSDEQRLTGFYRLWTKKEAFVKAVGRGIALGMDLCEFELPPDGQLISIPAEFGAASDWRVNELALSPLLSAALVTRRDRFSLRRREIP
ncbi:4'-phosphopantetheinyl transferase family protein [Methylomonas sp. MgM2]